MLELMVAFAYGWTYVDFVRPSVFLAMGAVPGCLDLRLVSLVERTPSTSVR